MSYYDFSGYAQDNSQKPDKNTDVVRVDETIRRKYCTCCKCERMYLTDEDGNYCNTCFHDI